MKGLMKFIGMPKLLDFGETIQDAYFIVMDLLGDSLKDIARR